MEGLPKWHFVGQNPRHARDFIPLPFSLGRLLTCNSTYAAHMQARFSILRTFLNAGVEFCELEFKEDDLSDLTIRLERSRILDLGRQAVDAYLQKLHIYKSTADFDAAKKMYDEITTVEPFYENRVRPAVLKKKTPRKVFVQANTVERDGKVELKEYEASAKGMIQSCAEREYV